MQNYKLKIMVGIGFDRNGDVVNSSTAIRALNDANKAIAHECGGCTRYPATGSYIYNDGHVVCEPSEILEVYGNDLGKLQKLGLSVGRKLRAELNQESVLVVIEPVVEVKFVCD